MARFVARTVAGQLTGTCPVCGRKVASGAGMCGNCLTGWWSKRSIAVMLIGLGGAYYYAYLHPHNDESIFSSFAAAAPETVVARLPEHFEGWAYETIMDPVLGDATQHARLMGNGPRPASGQHDAMLELTASQRYGKRLTITFPKVQQACAANACQVSLAWDDAPPDPYNFSAPTLSNDGSDTVLQTDEYDRFVGAVGKARKLRVVASLGMQDDYVLTFPVAGFERKKVQ